jgi:cysteine-rich repeat protein
MLTCLKSPAPLTALASLALSFVCIACSSGDSLAPPAPHESSQVKVALRVNSNGLPVVGDTTQVQATLACDGFDSTTSIPVPLTGSMVSGTFGSVRPAKNCQVTLRTTVKLDVDLDPSPTSVRDTVQCQASSERFDLATGQLKQLGTIQVVCHVSLGGDVEFEGEVVLVPRTLDEYFVGPFRIANDPETGLIPPVSLSIQEPLQPNAGYSWSVRPSGVGRFEACDQDPTNCEFYCQANGDFQIVLTGNFGSETLSGKVPIHCRVSRCGNSYVELTESCDDNNTVSGDGCSDVCMSEFCGDGQINNAQGGIATEQCDDGNTFSGDGCNAGCALEYCGDGLVNNNGSEECDSGPGGSIECRPDCTLVPSPYCEGCLDALYTNGSNAACTANAHCKAVRECAVNTDCYIKGGDVATCYCGPGVPRSTCIAASYVPAGVCRTEIVAAFNAGGLAMTNVAIVSQLGSSSNFAGQAMTLLTGAATFNRCLHECSLSP